MSEKNESVILLSHGDGGVKTSELISGLIKKHLGNTILDKLEDSAVLNCRSNKKIAFTTDSFVVDPIFFPGGDIGKLCICGTINDLVTTGCTPSALSLSFILEEGFPLRDLEKIIISIKDTLSLAGEKIDIVTGDTKVVEKGNADKLYINTAGIGFIDKDIDISPSKIKKGDIIIINGPIADHGLAILSQRKEFNFKSSIISDCAPLNHLVADMLSASKKISALRDATRGGLARVLIEMADASSMDFEIYEKEIPVKREARGICEFLGLDPLYIANEGKIIAFVSENEAPKVLEAMKKNRYGKSSKIIGRVTGRSGSSNANVILITELGTKRILDMHYSEQLPRIC